MLVFWRRSAELVAFGGERNRVEEKKSKGCQPFHFQPFHWFRLAAQEKSADGLPKPDRVRFSNPIQKSVGEPDYLDNFFWF